MPDRDPNIAILELAAFRLGPLLSEVVFTGGSTVGLLITDPGATYIRPTKDVDVITEVSAIYGYYQISDKLRELGFKEDSSDGAPLYRWVNNGLILDVMPTDPDILGFSNRWYSESVRHAQEQTLPSGNRIQCTSPPYFLATKLEAFDGRGNNDYLLSHDIEDLVTVIDGRPEIIDDIAASEPGLISYLADRFEGLLRSRAFTDAVAGHLPPDTATQERLEIVLKRMGAIISAR